jgi:hypothetical protein
VAEKNRPSAATSMVPALFGRTPEVLRRVDRLLDSKRNATRKLSFVTAAIAMCTIAIGAAELRAFPLVGEVRAALAIPDAPALIHAAFSIASGLETPVLAQKISTPAATTRALPRAGSDEMIPDAPLAEIIVDTVETIIPSRTYPARVAQENHSEAQSARKLSDAWQFGATIGKVTRRASVAVADSATKAGVSIAKSF